MNVDLTPEQVNQAFAELADTEPIRCQCIIGCPDHPRGGCSHIADVVFEVHLIGDCRGVEANPAGNRLEVLCTMCAKRMVVGVTEMVCALLLLCRQLLLSGTPRCPACGLEISDTTHVIRSVRHHPGGLR